jgi:hypothetical protein
VIPTVAPGCPAALITLLKGDPVRWRDIGLTREELFAVCEREELQGLLCSRITAGESGGDWPAEICAALSQRAREETAREMLRREEIAGVLCAIAAAGVRAIVLKGTALAYTVYEAPMARPRLDTDLLIDGADAAAARAVLAARGYAAPPYCDDLFAQFQMERTDEFGLRHVFDVHWKISTQPVFAGVLTFEEMLPRAVAIPPLGPSAVAPCAVDALLLACIHPAMHHQNTERVLWAYDSHLLASRLANAEFAEFARRARQNNVAAVCAHALRLAHRLFGTVLPADVMAELSMAADEPSAEYLTFNRRWHHELVSSVRGLPRFMARARFVRDVLLPSPSYMIGVYGLHDKPLARWLLPALYVHRNVRGAWKILMGKK